MGTDQQRVKWAELRTQWGASSESVAQDLKKIERVSAFPQLMPRPLRRRVRQRQRGLLGRCAGIPQATCRSFKCNCTTAQSISRSLKRLPHHVHHFFDRTRNASHSSPNSRREVFLSWSISLFPSAKGPGCQNALAVSLSCSFTLQFLTIVAISIPGKQRGLRQKIENRTGSKGGTSRGGGDRRGESGGGTTRMVSGGNGP